MTKRERTVLFVIGATIFNLALTVLITIAVFLAYVFTLARISPPKGVALPLGISFILGILLANLIYKKALVILGRRVNLEEKFGLLISKEKRRP